MLNPFEAEDDAGRPPGASPGRGAGLRELIGPKAGRLALSGCLALAEAVGWVVVPYMIGAAIDLHLAGSASGLFAFAAVGLATVGLATVRRLHDVRLHAAIYQRAGQATLGQDARLSVRTARLNMAREAVDFLEHSVPTLIESATALVGSLLFLAALNPKALRAALLVTALVAAAYAFSTRRTLELNRRYNDEYERQVDVLARDEAAASARHIGMLNRWTIKLSDIDAANFAWSFCLAIGLAVYAIVSSAAAGVEHGALLAIMLYVLEFSWTVTILPSAWQESLRLRDILARLGAPVDADD